MNTKRMRVYLSGPITGRDLRDVRIDFTKAAASQMTLGHTVINPYRLHEVLPDGSWEEYMKLCLSLIDMCDIIYLMRGWEKSKGCKKELEVAKKLKKIIMYGSVED